MSGAPEGGSHISIFGLRGLQLHIRKRAGLGKIVIPQKFAFRNFFLLPENEIFK